MTDSTLDEYFSANHKRLLRFASVANVFVWIVLIITLLLVIGQFLGNLNIYHAATQVQDSFWALWQQNTLMALRLTVGLLRTLVQGLALALILRGVALALDMVVETDLNYRANRESRHE